MSTFTELSAGDWAKIKAKLNELQQKTGQSWAYEIIERSRSHNRLCLLEISVNGHVVKPIALDSHDAQPAKRICQELDRVKPSAA